SATGWTPRLRSSARSRSSLRSWCASTLTVELNSMALARVRRGESGMNYWPGFVDALSTLILGIIFLLTVFVVVQFYLQQEVAGRNDPRDACRGRGGEGGWGEW